MTWFFLVWIMKCHADELWNPSRCCSNKSWQGDWLRWLITAISDSSPMERAIRALSGWGSTQRLSTIFLMGLWVLRAAAEAITSQRFVLGCSRDMDTNAGLFSSFVNKNVTRWWLFQLASRSAMTTGFVPHFGSTLETCLLKVPHLYWWIAAHLLVRWRVCRLGK